MIQPKTASGRPVTTTGMRKAAPVSPLFKSAIVQAPVRAIATATRRPTATTTTTSRQPGVGRTTTMTSRQPGVVRTTTMSSRQPGVVRATRAATPVSRPGVHRTGAHATAPTRHVGVRTTATTRHPGVHATTTTRHPGVHAATTTRHPGVRATATTTIHHKGTHPHHHVTGWPHHGKKLHHHAHPGTTTTHTPWGHRRHAGTTKVIRHGRHGQYIPGAPGGTVEYIQQTTGQPMPAGQTQYTSQPMPTAQPQYTQYTGQPAGVYIPTGQPRPVGTCPTSSGPAPISAPAPASTRGPRRTCHNCGTSVRGCTTLDRFAFNSAELTTTHKDQLRQLAGKILRKGSNTVIATGHADSSGSEDYNESLGEKRAAAVVRELKRQLRQLKPGSQKLLLWKTDSKGEMEPVSQTDMAANRRVSICVRKASFHKQEP